MVYASRGSGLTRTVKYKLGARTGKYKLRVRAGKHKLRTRTINTSGGPGRGVGVGAGGQAEGQKQGNTNTLKNLSRFFVQTVIFHPANATWLLISPLTDYWK